MLSILLIAILTASAFALTKGLRNKAEQARCIANMKSIFAALAAYTNDYKHWPQPPAGSLADEDKFWDFWFEALDEYDIDEDTWMCPTYKRLSHKEGSDKRRSSYMPAGFDGKSPATPYRWANQPWLMEIGDHHGKGPFVLRPDGSVRPFNNEMAE